MKFSSTIESGNYRFVFDPENGHDEYIIGFESIYNAYPPQTIIDSAFRSPYKQFLNEDICKALDNAYQAFLKKVYAHNNMKYRKQKVNYRFISFEEMQAKLRNDIVAFQKENGFSDKKWENCLTRKYAKTQIKCLFGSHITRRNNNALRWINF